MARNDITGDNIKTKTSNNAYRSGWDMAFGKKETVGEMTEEEKEWMDMPDVGNEVLCSCTGSNGVPCVCEGEDN